MHNYNMLFQKWATIGFREWPESVMHTAVYMYNAIK